MAKSTYQTFTSETPFSIYRTDFLRREALCGALMKRYSGLAGIGVEAKTIVGQIDERQAALQAAEDDQDRARAIEDAEKLDVIEVYTELRRTLSAKKVDVLTLLPDAPSTLGRLGIKALDGRMKTAIANLKALPGDNAQKAAFLPLLEKELVEMQAADAAEDTTRNALQAGRVALLLYKAELSQTRESQLGAVLKELGDKEKTALFTVDWRKASKGGSEEEEAAAPDAGPKAPVAGSTPT